MDPVIKKPIFFIGAPRSGTTILFEAFAVHEELAWFSNFMNKFPNWPYTALLSRLSIGGFRGAKKQGNRRIQLRNLIPFPAECYPVWEKCCGSEFLTDFLINNKAHENKRKNTIEYVATVLKFQGKRRFATKLTGPSRIGYIRSIFPDAKFIHIIRDGRAVVNSLFHVDFWLKNRGLSKPWWHGGLTDEDTAVWKQRGKSPAALAALQWRRIIIWAREEARSLGNEQYIEVKYEDFIEQPNLVITQMFKFGCLSNSLQAHRYIKKKSGLKSNNYKYSRQMKKEDISIINEVAGDILSALGYGKM